MERNKKGQFLKGGTPWDKGKKLHYPIWNKDKKTGLVPKTAFQKGHLSWNKGTHIQTNTGKTHFKKGEHPSLKTEWKKGDKRLLGKNHPNWNNGSSFEPYSVDWTDDLKRAIRKRDKYTCQICGKEPATIIHHEDYDKKNCNPDNLITLCRSCHTKTNHNRKYWINYFNKSNN